MKRRFDSFFLIYERQLQLVQSPKNYSNLIFYYGIISVAMSDDVSGERR
jgi:hypothetical protein